MQTTKGKNLVCLAISAGLMLLLPWFTVTLVKGDAGLGVCFLLFFAVDPVTAAAVGVFSGRNLRTAWFQPAALAALFLAGTWLVFSMGEPAFLIYGGVYLLLGYAAMWLTWCFRGRKLRRSEG